MTFPLEHALSSDRVERTLGVGTHARPWRRLVARIGLAATLAALTAIAASALTRATRRPTEPRFETAVVTRGDLRVTVTATGTLHAVGTVEVSSEISGRVQDVAVGYNDHVRRGELLADIDPVQLRTEVAQASSQVRAAAATHAQAMSTLRQSKAALDRAEAQHRQALMSTQDLETARGTYERAKAGVEGTSASYDLAAAALQSASWKLGKARLVSPIDGIVLTRTIEPGQTVQAAFTAPVLFKLAADLARLELHVQVDEADIGRVREGEPAEFRVEAYPEKSFSARLEKLHNDPTTSENVVSYEAVLSVDNAEHLLRPGMSATATIVSDARSGALLVPNAALRFTPPASRGGGPPGAPPHPQSAPTLVPPPDAPSKNHVFVLRGGRPTAVFVRTGATDGKSTELIGSDLPVGDTVVTDVLESEP